METSKQIHKVWERRMAKMLVALLILSMLPIFGVQYASAAQSGMIRVKLTRLGSSLTSITMKTTGSYKVGSTSIGSGSTVKVTLESGSLYLTINGTKSSAGSSVTLNRTKAGVSNGVSFTSPSVSNLYCGDLTFTISGGSIVTVLTTYIETYLYGVVGYEMSNSFPVEALKAQAVAARTYAMRSKSSSGSYDLLDSSSSQVFRGYPSSYTNVIAAVNGTVGVCLTYNGTYASCYYTASNGGQTELPANPWGGSNAGYYKMKDDPYDVENTSSVVKSHKIPIKPTSTTLNSSLKSAMLEAMASQLSVNGISTSGVTINEITGIEPHTPRYASPSKTYTQLRFTAKVTGKSASTGSTVSATVTFDLATYAKLEGLLGLSINSADNEVVSVARSGDYFVLYFRRYGHGIGMSQRGAQWMAKQYGRSYSQILSFYYEGTTQTKLSLTDTSGSGSGGSTIEPMETPDANGYVTLKQGNSSAAVKALQQRLKTLGYFTGTPSGNYQTLTLAAVKAYQKAMGLTQDGIATPALQVMIFGTQPTATPTPAPTAAATPTPTGTAGIRTLKSGSTGEAVKALQQRLKTLGYFTGTPQGNYKSLTIAAVKAYQKAMGLPQDGIATPELQAMIYTKIAVVSGTVYRQVSVSIAGSRLNVRKGFSTASTVVGQLVHGDRVQLLATVGDWSRIKAGSITGYVMSKYLVTDGAIATVAAAVSMPTDQETVAPTQAPTAEPTEEPAKDETFGYTSINPGESGSHVKKLQSRLQELKYFGGSIGGNYKSQTTSAVKAFQKAVGLAQDGIATPETQYLLYSSGAPKKSASAKYAYVIDSSVTVRVEPATGSSTVTSLGDGAKVQVLVKMTNWARIKSGGSVGYVPTGCLGSAPTSTASAADSGDANATIKFSVSYMNLRAEASTASASLAKLKSGTRVQVISDNGTWCKIVANGKTGFVKLQYIVMD